MLIFGIAWFGVCIYDEWMDGWIGLVSCVGLWLGHIICVYYWVRVGYMVYFHIAHTAFDSDGGGCVDDAATTSS